MSSRSTRRWGRRAGFAGAGGVAALALCSAVFASASGLTPVTAAQPKVAGVTEPNVLSRQLTPIEVARGSMPLENPGGGVGNYGYDSDGPLLPAPGDLPSVAHKVEATKTEPDKNTYLVMQGQTGADAGYDYGTHFLFQGHELGLGYITRVNLDADVTHRVTMLATQDSQAQNLPPFDGSTWDPWAQRLLFTSESGTTGGVWQATTAVPSTVDNLQGVIGIGGYEGIQNDSSGNLWIVEDVGGPAGVVNTHAKQPNSFIYRFVPNDKTDLTAGGKLQVLKVDSIANPGSSISFHAGQADADILSQDVKDLHTYGNRFAANFVTIHDTAIDPPGSFNANTLAKAANATPFKRPENGMFRPGSHFREFYFDETGDTNSLTEAGSQYGGFGGVMKLVLSSTGGSTGTLSPLYVSDAAHSSFDNVAFMDRNRVTFVQDMGDTLHGQINALDSAFIFDVRSDYSNPATPAPVRWLAEGRDPSATLDSGFLGMAGFQNEGDNEITGMHVSNGDAGIGGILGGRTPNAFSGGWRVFFTQQHGDNQTFEIVRAH